MRNAERKTRNAKRKTLNAVQLRFAFSVSRSAFRLHLLKTKA